MANFLPVVEAAKLAGTDPGYIHKLIRRGQLISRYTQRGTLKYWFVDVECDRFQALLLRHTGTSAPTAPTPTSPPKVAKAHPVDWDTWANMLKRGEEICSRPCTSGTIKQYRKYLTRFIETYGGVLISRDTLRKALGVWEAQETPDRDYYSSKTWLYRSVLTLAKYLIFKGLEPPSLLSELTPLRPRKKHVMVSRPCHPQKTIEEILNACSTARNKNGAPSYNQYDLALIRVFVGMARGCAARNGELCGIRMQDIDWGRRSIRLFGKGGKERYVGITSSMLAVMQEYNAMRPESKEYNNFLLYKEGDRVGPMTPASFARRLKRLGERAGVKKFTPHSLRRSGITQMLTKDGIDLVTVQKIVGHTDIKTTSLYAQPSTEDIIDALRDR